MRNRYIPIKKAIVHIAMNSNFKKVFYGLRTLYAKDCTGKVYIRYKNKYYRAYSDGYYPTTYYVRL